MGFYKGKNVLVTGGAGIAGHSAVKKLLQRGAHVKATIYNSKKLDLPDHPNLEVTRCDLHSYEKCLELTEGMDIVFNLVAYIRGAKSQTDAPIDLVRNNIVPAVNMMDAAVKSKVDRFGFIGSSTMYPDVDYPVKESEAFNSDPHPVYTGVGWMKRYSEKVIEHFNDISNTKFSIVRTTAMYGPHDSFNERGHAIPQLILKADKGMNPFHVWGDGTQVRDFVYVDDVIGALLLVTEKNPIARAYNVASGTPTTIKQLVETITRIYGYKPEFDFDLTKPVMIPKRLVDVSLIKKELDWEAEHGLQEGLEKTIKWFKENNQREI
jgi:GDP-L-fucose synthase